MLTPSPPLGGPLTKVLATGHPCWAVEWSPDGRWLAVEALAKGLERNIWLVPLAGGRAGRTGRGDQRLVSGLVAGR